MKLLNNIKIEHWTILFGLLVFSIGALIYPLRTYIGGVNGVFMESFSAFSHAFFFVLAWGFPYSSIRSIILGGVLITAMVTWFEYLQQPEVLLVFENYLPNMIYNYASNGRFDSQDVMAGYVGSALAVVIGSIVVLRKNKQEVMR
ncbi:MAG: hypothetical protein COB24_02860 [Hyphomicrobiales bacterium]|nr:MAG: hypothetical protein COB24_02860 [Hyphomicrobiales bacterium]